MLTIDIYCDAAKALNNLNSDRDLAKHLKVAQASVSAWRTKRMWPSSEVMILLADLARMDRATALLSLQCWKTEGSAKDTYKDILQRYTV